MTKRKTMNINFRKDGWSQEEARALMGAFRDTFKEEREEKEDNPDKGTHGVLGVPEAFDKTKRDHAK